MATDLSWETYKEQISQIATLDYNYDEQTYHASKDKQGWKIDKYHALLGTELPGLPLEQGPFARVKEAVLQYHFPDPDLISAVFDPSQPLLGRNMYMIAHFLGMTFNFGVRVTSVVDEVRKNEVGADLRVWGYSYRTLKGHFEVGEIAFLVTKNLSTGEIFFNIDAYSTPEKISNWFYRTGFRVFGRSLQKYFANSAVRRLRALITN